MAEFLTTNSYVNTHFLAKRTNGEFFVINNTPKLQIKEAAINSL